jgi:hypothetical protein
MNFVWRGLLLRWENYEVKKLGPKLRYYGQKIYKLGAKIQGDFFQEDRRIIILKFLINSCPLLKISSYFTR